MWACRCWYLAQSTAWGSFVKLMNEDITQKNLNESLDAFKYNHCLFCFYAIMLQNWGPSRGRCCIKNKTPHVLECHEAAVVQNGNVDTGTHALALMHTNNTELLEPLEVVHRMRVSLTYYHQHMHIHPVLTSVARGRRCLFKRLKKQPPFRWNPPR